MRKVIEVLRLKYEARLSHARIARPCGLSKGTVSKCVSLAQAEGIADHFNLCLTGPTGCGKTWIACALGNLLPGLLGTLPAASHGCSSSCVSPTALIPT